jgi:uncharacterized damage-inducible protein DinB
MTMTQALLQELEQEAATTRRVLERVPNDRLAWKPHDKSMSLGQLALHVATVPGNVAELSQKSPFQIPQFTQPSAASSAELLPALEDSIRRAKAVLLSLDDAALGKMWRLMDGDREVMAIPVAAMLRTIMLNHWYHHRGQMAVYLRQVGVPVPSIYGPSADENPFAAKAAAATA